MKPIAVIPARGGSKGLPGKNIRPLAGKPLIHYTIEAARAVFEDHQVLVSTDNEEIREVASQTKLEVPFLRPAALATDTATTRDALIHAIEWYRTHRGEVDTVVLLQPTSPLRTGDHIREALAMYQQDMDMVVSVKETDANPYYVLFEENEDGFLRKSKASDVTRRQDLPVVWEYNGAVYVINIASLEQKPIHEFQKVVKYVMDSVDSVDIDTALDFDLCELIIQKGYNKA